MSKSNTCSYKSETLHPTPLKPLRVILPRSHTSHLPSSTWSTHCEKKESVACWPLPCACFSCSWNFLGQVDSAPHSDCQTAISCLTFSSEGSSESAKGCRYEPGQEWDAPCSSVSDDTPSTVLNTELRAVSSFSAIRLLYNKVNLQGYCGSRYLPRPVSTSVDQWLPVDKMDGISEPTLQHEVLPSPSAPLIFWRQAFNSVQMNVE